MTAAHYGQFDLSFAHLRIVLIVCAGDRGKRMSERASVRVNRGRRTLSERRSSFQNHKNLFNMMMFFYGFDFIIPTK